MPTLTLDGTSLAIEDLQPALDGQWLRLRVTREAKARVREARKLVDRKVRSGEPVYGLTTGFGKLKSVTIEKKDLAELQHNLVLSHCCGVGEPMPVGEVRAVQILRLNGLLRGHSGVRLKVIEKLVRFFNAGFVPVVPQQGSVGASGDLAPLAHLTAAYMGFGEAILEGKRMTAKRALKRVGEEPLVLAAKEGLALLNGTEAMAAVGAGAYLRAVQLSKGADAVASLTIEALEGSERPFDPRLAELKGQPGHARTSANMRKLLADSKVLESHEDCDRVQDPYSLRCIPQVHGAFKAALAHVGEVLAAEMNSVTDNPILFPDTDEIISAGQFHGQPIATALDYLALATCTLANISERRVEQLVNPDLSRLQPFLAAEPGLNSGMMIAQVAAASLAAENKSYAHPASIDTIPTSANQEDHVSMGMTSARKLRAIVTNTERLLGIEYLCAGQAREFQPDHLPGKGARAAYDLLRKHVKPMVRDRYLHTDIETASQLLASGAVLKAVEAKVGALEA